MTVRSRQGKVINRQRNIKTVNAVKRERVTRRIGRMDVKTVLQLNRSLALFLGIAQ
jgi:hypothetical protein